MPHVLVVDDEQSICWGLTKLAGKLGYTADAAGSAEQGLLAARQQRPDVIVLDVRLPGMDGLAALHLFQELLGPVPVIIITAYGQLETAVEAIRRGAFEYLVKPFDLTLAERTLERALAASQNQTASRSDGVNDIPPDGDAATRSPHSQQIIGSSPAMQVVFKQIALVAPTDACVHVHGESGTGKELVARAIHRYSRRAAGPFVPMNLAALSPSLSESELFGHVRGAFTGAEQPRKGLLEQADGGTVFLDEVADIPASLQVKLLRALEHGEIWPVGADQPRRADFRLISATHGDLREQVGKGTFRHDLFFRMITFQIDLPPLRERREDIAQLALHFAAMLADRNGGPRCALPPELLAELESRPWYGNARELRNAIEHASILARGTPLTVAHLPPPAPGPTSGGTSGSAAIDAALRGWTEQALRDGVKTGDLYERYLQLVEPPLLAATLNGCGGQVVAAARRLGLHRTTIAKKLHQYGLSGGH